MIATFTGVVQKGAGRGAGLGYPTANIQVSDAPPPGIYAGFVLYKNRRYQAAIFYGVPETFEHSAPQLEAHVLDFSSDLYGEMITVELYKKIRDSKKFQSIQELTNAIAQDINDIRQCLQE